LESLSLSKLNLYLRRVISLNFQEPLWVTADILNIKFKNKNVYLELSEKDDKETILAQNSAVIWSSSYSKILQTRASDISNILQEGNEVKLFVIVDYNIRYGLKLKILDIDPEYTLGKIAKKRIQTIQKLQEQNLWQRNKECQVPIVLKRLALITSINSAGHMDFEHQLKNNKYSYTFSIYKYNVSVQGKNSSEEIQNAFHEIRNSKIKFDLILLIRGGGSKLDLLEFDSYQIAREISVSEIPVITGIGHFIDESIADLSAYLALKTPTAVAEFIISLNYEAEIRLQKLFESLNHRIKSIIDKQLSRLNNSGIESKINIKERLITKYKNLKDLQTSIIKVSYQLCNGKTQQLSDVKYLIQINDPDELLRRGYTITYINELIISKCKNIQVGDTIKTIHLHGVINSKVIKNEEV
jgi:exodeoxyribonuclease VII large subunit